jgi:hypothetical protein
MSEDIKIEVGQVWRKLGPLGWIKITHIEDPNYPDYDGGLIGVGVIFLPQQKEKINLNGKKRGFMPGVGWENWVRDHRFLYEKGQPANMM